MSPSISGVAAHLVNSAQGLRAAPGNVTQSFQKFHKLKLLFFFNVKRFENAVPLKHLLSSCYPNTWYSFYHCLPTQICSCTKHSEGHVTGAQLQIYILMAKGWRGPRNLSWDVVDQDGKFLWGRGGGVHFMKVLSDVLKRKQPQGWAMWRGWRCMWQRKRTWTSSWPTVCRLIVQLLEQAG